jgi:hypothetical protein
MIPGFTRIHQDAINPGAAFKNPPIRLRRQNGNLVIWKLKPNIMNGAFRLKRIAKGSEPND